MRRFLICVTFIWQSSISFDIYADRLHQRSSPLYSTSSKQYQQQHLQEQTKINFHNLINDDDNAVVVADGSFYRKPKSKSTSSSPRNSWFVNKEEEDDSSFIRSTNRYNNYINTTDDVFYERQPQQQHQQQQQRTVKDFSSRDSRIGFIRKVYAIFTTQIFITICITYMIINNLNIQNFLLSYPKELLIFNMVSSIGTITAFSTIPSLRYNMPWNFILLGIFSFILYLIEIILFIFILTYHHHCFISFSSFRSFLYSIIGLFTISQSIVIGTFSSLFETSSVLLASSHTLAIFSTITLYLFQSNPTYDLTIFGNTLLSLLTSLIVGSILNIFFSISIIDNIITSCLIILFSFYIMYDTQLIIGGKHHKKSYNSDDYIIASLSLYQDVISLFMKILKFMGKLKEKSRD